MSKEHITIFKCDFPTCLSGEQVKADDKNKNPFPYSKGWIYVYNIQIKNPEQTEFRDKHFCSQKCFQSFCVAISMNTIKSMEYKLK